MSIDYGRYETEAGDLRTISFPFWYYLVYLTSTSVYGPYFGSSLRLKEENNLKVEKMHINLEINVSRVYSLTHLLPANLFLTIFTILSTD